MKFGFVSKHFPPPEFLKPRHIGVSFSDTSIKAVFFDKKSDKQSFKSFVVPIEKGAIINGGIANAAELVKKLSILRKNFDSPFVFFTVPDELVYVFSASVPSSGDDVTEAVTFIIEENVPLSLNETVFDFNPIQIEPSGSEYSASVVVAACAQKEIEKFSEIFYKSGFEPVGCMHESQAIARSVVPKKLSGTFSIIHARENRIGIHLAKDKTIVFSTIRNVSEDYEKEFLDEYEKFLDYCTKYSGGIKDQLLKGAFVCGQFGSAQKIIEAVNGAKNGQTNVKLSNVWVNVFDIDKHLPEIPFEKSLNFAGAIGAAISDIN